MKAWARSLIVLILLGLGTFPVYQACQVQLGASTAGNPSGTGKGGLPDGLESFLGGQLKIQVDNTVPNLQAMPTYRSDLRWMNVTARILNPSATSSAETLRAFLIPRGAMDLEADNHGSVNVRFNSDGTFIANLTVTRPLISGMKYRLGFSDAGPNKIRQTSTNEFQYGPGDTTSTEIPGGTIQEFCDSVQSELPAWINQAHPFSALSLPYEGTNPSYAAVQNPFFSSVYWTDPANGQETQLNPYLFATSAAADTLTGRWGQAFLEPVSQGTIRCQKMDQGAFETGNACSKRVFQLNGFKFSVGDALSRYLNNSEFYAEYSLRSMVAKGLSLPVPPPLIATCLWRAGYPALGLRPL